MFSKYKSYLNTNTLQNFNKLLSKQMLNSNKNNNSSSTTKTTTISSAIKYGLLGLGTGGLVYVTYQAGVAQDEYLKSTLYSAYAVHHQIVLQRVKDTLTYFGAGLGLTSILTYAMMRSPAFLDFSVRVSMRPFMYLALTIPSLMLTAFGMSLPALPENSALKHISWLAFNSLISFSIMPFVYVSGALLAQQAALMTAGAVGGLAYVAHKSKNDAFLGLNGILAAGSGVMLACAISSFFSNSLIVYNVWLYGGLGLFMAYVLYDVNQIKIEAERSYYYDPMSESVRIYMDTVNIFVRILMILDNKRRKNN